MAMFAPRYFAPRYFASRYFTSTAGEGVEPPPPTYTYTYSRNTRRFVAKFPDAPESWSPTSREVWNSLILTLENTPFFGQGSRNPPQFVVAGTVSAATTLDLTSPSIANLNHVVARLLLSLQNSRTLDIRSVL